MESKQQCARWGCQKTATFEKPLCYEHWREWEAWELEECMRCHWFVGGDESGVYDTAWYAEEYPFLCDDCLWFVETGKGRPSPWTGGKPDPRPVHAHTKLDRPIRYIYILKLSDGSLYIGQTTNLVTRMQEHRDGLQRQTKGNDPKLVYFEEHEGARDVVNAREGELTIMNQDGMGRRRLREMVERFQAPLRLLDLSHHPAISKGKHKGLLLYDCASAFG